MHAEDDLLDLPAFCHELNDLAAETGGEAPPYRAVADKARDGLLPVRRLRGRWYLSRRDFPRAAAVFGLKVPPDHPKGRRRAA